MLTKITFHLPSVAMGTFVVHVRLTCKLLSNASCLSGNERTLTIAPWMSVKCNFFVAVFSLDNRIEMMMLRFS
jgi:hypothetical protein